MTLLVGILCKDGVVVGSDSAATLGATGQMTIGQQSVRKVVQCNEHIFYCGTGAVGIGQMLADKIKQMWDANTGSCRTGTNTTVAQSMTSIAQNLSGALRPFLETATLQRQITGEASASLCKSMVAMPIGQVPCLFTFDFNGAPEHATPELPFVAMGSGQMIADPFLAFLKRVLWKDSQPTIAEGRLAAVWTILHVERTNPGGVGGDIQLGTLAKRDGGVLKVEFEPPDSIQEHLARIESAEAKLLSEFKGIQPQAAQEVPQP